MSHIIITHTDADGWVAGAIVYKYLRNKYPVDEPIYAFHWNYGDGFSVIEGFMDSSVTDIWMTDITLPDEFMNKYHKLIHHFDHHASRINSPEFSELASKLKEEKSTITIKGYLDTSNKQAKQISACELVWLSLFPNTKMPSFVYSVGRYDVWDHDQQGLTYALHEYLNNFESDKYKELKWLDPKFFELFDNEDAINAAYAKGNELLKYKKLFNSKQSLKISSIMKINGDSIIVANIHPCGSQFFDDVIDKNKKYYNLKGIFAYGIDTVKSTCICSCYGLNPKFKAIDFLKKLYTAVSPEDRISIGGHDNSCGCIFKIKSLYNVLLYLNSNPNADIYEY